MRRPPAIFYRKWLRLLFKVLLRRGKSNGKAIYEGDLDD